MQSRSPERSDSSCKSVDADASELVLLTGTIPKSGGVGVERRAAQTLKALAKLGRVHVVYFGCGASGAIVPESSRGLCSSFTALSPGLRVDVGRLLRRTYLRVRSGPAPPAGLRRAIARLIELEGAAPPHLRLPSALLRRARRVHVFRLGALPLAAAWLGRGDTSVCVDLDDLESDTLSAIAQLAEAEREPGLAWTYAAMGAAAGRFERMWLRRVSRIGVCSESDRLSLLQRWPEAQVTVLPNVFEAPSAPPSRRLDPEVMRLLFVGALGYYPNLDAVRFAVRELLPRLRARVSRRLELHIAGRGMTRALGSSLGRVPELVVHGAVDTLDRLYATSDVALCPIRAGGGTRIKILEAFAYGVPVVSTSVGAAGLEVTRGRELLVEDDPADFADAVASLTCARRAQTIAERARNFVLVHHCERRFERALRALVAKDR